MTETEILRHIFHSYHHLIFDAARRHGITRPALLAGIMARETEGGLSRLLVPRGPAGRGDGGHGYGLMQIDDRSFPVFCQQGAWQDPATNIDMGAWVLSRKRAYLKTRSYARLLSPSELDRAAVAAYNAGEGRVLTSITAGADMDTYTAHGNYSREVLRLATAYEAIIAATPPPAQVGVQA